jgi:hypothetical protein
MAPEFPAPAMFSGRLKFIRYEIDDYKRALALLPPIDRGPEPPVVFVGASDVCADLGIDRRTLGRRVRGRVRGQ